MRAHKKVVKECTFTHFKCENRNVNEFLDVNYLNFYWVKYFINLFE